MWYMDRLYNHDGLQSKMCCKIQNNLFCLSDNCGLCDYTKLHAYQNRHCIRDFQQDK